MNLTLRDIKHLIDEQLGSVVPDPAQRTAERNLLLRHFLEVPPEVLIAYPERGVPYNESLDQLLDTLYQRVEHRMPLQYLLKEAVFYGFTFQVSPDTLIPRPETELLVEAALAFVQNKPKCTVLDLGTGTGCIAISIQQKAPHCCVTAVDMSEGALIVAARNAQTYDAPIRFLHGSWFAPVPLEETFDLIVSNPPYIDRNDAPSLTQEVLKEPHSALFSPQEPLVLIETLLTQARGFLKPGGQVLIELGAGQGREAQRRAQALGYAASLIPDYSGHQRILCADLPAEYGTLDGSKGI